MAKKDPPRPGARPRPGAGRPRPGAAQRPSAKRPAKGGASFQPGGGSSSPPQRAAPVVKPPEKHEAKDLDMVPLQESDAEPIDDGAPKSATAFFALPTPKRKAPEPEPEPAPSPQAGPPPGGMPPMGPGSMPPMGPGSMPGGMPPMGGIGIQGPVAGAPQGMPQAGYSMGGGTMAPPPDPDQDRARSYRVFALVGGLMLMVCTAVLVMGALVVGAMVMADDDAAADATPPTAAPAPRPRPRKVVDTGIKEPKPRPRPRPRPSGSPSPRPSPRPAPAPTPPPAPVGPATSTVKIPSSAPFTGVEVTCPISGFRERATFAGGSASIPSVPQEDCALLFKGGPPARNTIRGGQTINCDFPNGQAVCK